MLVMYYSRSSFTVYQHNLNFFDMLKRMPVILCMSIKNTFCNPNHVVHIYNQHGQFQVYNTGIWSFQNKPKKISVTNYNLILVSNNINEYITKNVDKVTVTLQFLLSMRLRIKQNQLDFYVCYFSYVFVIKLKH